GGVWPPTPKLDRNLQGRPGWNLYRLTASRARPPPRLDIPGADYAEQSARAGAAAACACAGPSMEQSQPASKNCCPLRNCRLGSRSFCDAQTWRHGTLHLLNRVLVFCALVLMLRLY